MPEWDTSSLRGLSIRQPWASLVASGHKTIENRRWRTPYRGPLVIHAGQRWDPAGERLAAEIGAPATLTARRSTRPGYLAVIELIDVHPSEGCCTPWGFEEPEIWHWVLTNPRPLPQRLSGPGALRLFRLPPEVVALAASVIDPATQH